MACLKKNLGGLSFSTDIITKFNTYKKLWKNSKTIKNNHEQY